MLLRLIDSLEGNIFISDLNVRLLSYKQLRGGISIIPQEPLILKGTFRSNLDLLDSKKFTDDDLWTAVGLVSLRSKVEEHPLGLDGPMLEQGANLSSGEKQLLCLARALLRRTKIVLLDEVTANVDAHTDVIIQNSIARNFSDCTVFTIAHRLKTLEHCDFVMIIGDGGCLKDVVKPQDLCKDHEMHIE